MEILIQFIYTGYMRFSCMILLENNSKTIFPSPSRFQFHHLQCWEKMALSSLTITVNDQMLSLSVGYLGSQEKKLCKYLPAPSPPILELRTLAFAPKIYFLSISLTIFLKPVTGTKSTHWLAYQLTKSHKCRHRVPRSQTPEPRHSALTTQFSSLVLSHSTTKLRNI